MARAGIWGLLPVVLAAGCVAPLSHNLTGRSLGGGTFGIDAGALAGPGEGALPALKVAVGLSESADLGLQFDTFSLGFFGRKSFINNRETGPSLAGVIGLGMAAGGYYGYAGPVLSFKTGGFEPYLGARLNFVTYDESDSSSSISWEGGDFTYPQATLGFCFWFSRRVALNAEASALIGETGVLDAGMVGLAGLSFRL
jgi:hypothetical protein